MGNKLKVAREKLAKIDTTKLVVEAVEVFGEAAQYGQFHEEIGELMTAINQFRRGRVGKEEVVIEIADVLQMIEALKYVLDIDEVDVVNAQINQWKKLKQQIIEKKYEMNSPVKLLPKYNILKNAGLEKP